MNTQAKPIASRSVDKLRVKIYADRRELGRAAGQDVGARLQKLLTQQPQVRMIFAAAPSQNEFLQALSRYEGLDWSRVVAFHMDEYIGLAEDAPQRFARYLSDHLFHLVRPGQVHLINSSNDITAECKRYATLLRAAPIDIVCLGIGENGHIAFNDPPVADFNDPLEVKPVALDITARQQQVNDGCFARLEDVPTHAITLTIPTLLSGKALFCMVPGPTKRAAIRQTLCGPISSACPATALRRHVNCMLYLDAASAELIETNSP
ncbi:glucosamine-6-phosphate deaminase [Ktedonosporobacter rubrisoli]|uniref:Glucosamine-6-phosphate deaminase n=1 Tax=Ktedonosporobacter rubrisoli TaxID=2509675 RepID=A0A4P6JJ04_KTERU|nr:glucosamine-6-phosphate deaminase [Ktedonosporobacter rubrisoli]QBD74636.1 glucosamine-6-phosphate deaminase [Ktedonosporobacter rubrisoli]